MKTDQNTSADKLYDAILSLRSREECRAFLEDICTIREAADMAQRLETACLIDEGMSYRDITERVGASTATISRVNRCLKHGAGGYRIVIDRSKEAAE